MIEDLSPPANEAIQDILSTLGTLEKFPGAQEALPKGQTSPRSPLECDFESLKSSSSPIAKKTVVFAPNVEHAPALATKEKANQKVTFSNVVIHKEIRHIQDHTEEEKEAIWMAVRDYQIVKAMVKTTVLMMMKGEQISEDDEDFCTRGLEFRTKAGSKIRSRNKLRTRSAVLNEQDQQDEEGYFDPQFIAMTSMEQSRECKENALLRARWDERCIQSYLDDVRDNTLVFR